MIILAGTPIGNDDDASARLKTALAEADLIAAEDTRRLLNLVSRLNVEIHAPVIAYHDHIEAEKAPELIAVAQSGKKVVMVSDAGMPSISDPGFRLAAQAAAAGVALSVIPGPSAPVTALAISGLPSNRFTFEGFLPRKDGERAKFLANLAREPRTMIFFESPRRLAQTLQDMCAAFSGTRNAAVCRELTKIHEEVQRGTLAELCSWAQSREILGEIVVVVAGVSSSESDDASALETLVPEVLELVDLGLRLKDAAAYIAKKNNVRKNALYQAALDAER